MLDFARYDDDIDRVSARWLAGSIGVYLALAILAHGRATNAEPPNEWNPPWHEMPMVPLPPGTRSLQVDSFDTPVWDSPGGARRGSLTAGVRLPILGSRRPTTSCRARWYLVGPLAWVCGEQARPSTSLPTRERLKTPPDGMPYRYYFVGRNGAFAYSASSLIDEGVPDSQLEPGFAVAAVAERSVNGERTVFTTNGLWIPVRDLVEIRGSRFQGVHLEDTAPTNIGWVIGKPLTTSDAPFGKAVRRVAPLSSVRIEERRELRGVVWARLEAGDWVRERDLRLPRLAPPPSQVKDDERWIDVDTSTQILTAYVGARAMFTTLVSTGKGHRGSATVTPVGEHRIWVKLASSDMTNVEDRDASQYYAIEAVPWVQFFKAGYGLHAAFWHEGFGAPRSHGCVNLSPKDASFLFTWTEPPLPPGWHAVLPTSVQPGTLVRVR